MARLGVPNGSDFRAPDGRFRSSCETLTLLFHAGRASVAVPDSVGGRDNREPGKGDLARSLAADEMWEGPRESAGGVYSAA